MEEYKVKDTKTLKQKLIDKNLPYECLGEYVKSRTKILFNKTDCNHEAFYATPNNILKGEYNCPECGRIARKMTKRKNGGQSIEKVNETINELYPEKEYELIPNQIYKNNKEKLDVKCNNCGDIFGISLVNIRSGKGCPNCRRLISKGVRKIEYFLNEHDINYEKEFIFKDCKRERYLPFDFKVNLSKDKFILIEYDGEQHFRPSFTNDKNDKVFLETQIRDNIKNEYCQKNDIELIRIPYHQFRNIDKILKNNLL